MPVIQKVTFRQAYERGKTDKIFRAIRGKAIHVRPRRVAVPSPAHRNAMSTFMVRLTLTIGGLT